MNALHSLPPIIHDTWWVEEDFEETISHRWMKFEDGMGWGCVGAANIYNTNTPGQYWKSAKSTIKKCTECERAQPA